MHIKLLNFRELLLKSFIFLVLIYFGLISLSFIVTGYLFLTLDSYTAKIEKFVYEKTSYHLTIKNIETKINDGYLPELIFTGISLQNSKNIQQKFSIEKLEMVLSYNSIWNLTPVFNKIMLDGAPLNLTQEHNGDLILNGINLKQFAGGDKESSFDFEHWLLLQGSIKISHLNFSFLDRRNNLPQIALRNISIDLDNKWNNSHSLYVEVLNNNDGGNLEAKLQWTGGKLEQWQTWSIGEFYLANINKSGTLLDNLNKYLPDVDLLKKFSSQAVVSAKILNGQVQYVKANFGLNNFNLTLNNNTNIVNFPKLAGNLNLNLVDNKYYKLSANDLTISTQTGYLFKDAQITGSYLVDVGGDISLNNTNIQAFNNVLHRIPDFSKINLDGNIDIVKFSWDGSILKPKDYNLYSSFTNISMRSAESNLPSINNLSGNVVFNHESGVVNLALKDSVLTYPQVFIIPYKFKQLTTQIKWNIDKNNKILIQLPTTEIITPDFKVKAQGSYVYTPNKGAGFIDITAHLEQIKASLVSDYLPKSIGMGTHEWLKHGIKDGYAVNANLILKGDLDKFPYEKGGGLFYITADVKNAQLSYLDKWPTIDNIDGQFILKNQSIIIKANSAKVSGNNLTSANVEIPNYTTNKAFLTANGKANGSTQNFLNYLKNTWLNETLGGIPTTTEAIGNGEVEIALNIPFDKPEATKVSGKYKFDSNELKFNALPVPKLSNINGVLNFTERGVSTNTLQFSVLDSHAKLVATTNNQGKMIFDTNIESLNYASASKFYLSFLGNVIDGSANTNVEFIIDSTGLNKLTATSDLVGVAINAPYPIAKVPSSSDKLNLSLTQNGKILNLNYVYKDNLTGNVAFDHNGKLIVANAFLGENSEIGLDKPDLAKINIQLNLAKLDAVEWVKFVSSLSSSTENNVVDNVNESTIIANNNDDKTVSSEENSIFPIAITIATKDMKMASLSLGDGNANIWVTKEDLSFNFNFVRGDGYGGYNYKVNKAVLSLNNLRLVEPNKNNIESDNLSKPSENYNHVENTPLNWPLIDLKISQLYYQNRLIGRFGIQLSTNETNLFLKNGYIINDDMDVSFSGANMCILCDANNQYSKIQFLAKFSNLGNVVNNLGKGRIMEKGNGSIIGSLGWNGGMEDFDLNKISGAVNIQLSSGKFLQVNTGVFGSLFGGLLGIANLQVLTQFTKLGFNDLFSSGFFFNNLEANTNVFTGKLEIMQFKMLGSTADVISNGQVNLDKETVNLRMQVIPKLGLTTAVTAGVVTLNPFIGIGTYFAEIILGEPVNKLFGFDMHISGDLDKPNIDNIEISKQVYNNINSAIGKTN